MPHSTGNDLSGRCRLSFPISLPPLLRLSTSKIVITLLVLLTICSIHSTLYAQPGFDPGDVVTFADSRGVTSADYSTREVYLSSDGGLWRFDRSTMEPLDPIYSGYAMGQRIRLDHSSAVIYHEMSRTLFVAGPDGLFAKPNGIDHWQEVGNFGPDILRLGIRGNMLLLQTLEGFSTIGVLGYVVYSMQKDIDTTGCRWSPQKVPPGRKDIFPFYHSSDPLLRFEPSDGRLVDWDFKEYRPDFYRRDEEFERTYIGYPGLGLAIADDRRGSIEVFQPGPAGKGVRAIAMAEYGVIFLGGDGGYGEDGLNRFDRTTGRWDRVGVRQRWGYETRHTYDLLFGDGKLYGATEEGLLIGAVSAGSWSTYGLLEGAPEPPIWLVKALNGWLFIGGRSGLRKVQPPSKAYFDVQGPRNVDIFAADGIVDEDTLWLVGPQGIFKGGINGNFEMIGGDPVIGDEPSRAIAVTPDRVIVGGQSGVRLFDRETHKWRDLLSNAYFNGGKVYTLAARNDRIWIGTDRGLFQYDDHSGRLLPFSVEQGLPYEKVNKLMLEADTLWVGTRAGLTRLNINALYWR